MGNMFNERFFLDLQQTILFFRVGYLLRKQVAQKPQV